MCEFCQITFCKAVDNQNKWHKTHTHTYTHTNKTAKKNRANPKKTDIVCYHNFQMICLCANNGLSSILGKTTQNTNKIQNNNDTAVIPTGYSHKLDGENSLFNTNNTTDHHTQNKMTYNFQKQKTQNFFLIFLL